jgi:hypothetical protein
MRGNVLRIRTGTNRYLLGFLLDVYPAPPRNCRVDFCSHVFLVLFHYLLLLIGTLGFCPVQTLDCCRNRKTTTTEDAVRLRRPLSDETDGDKGNPASSTVVILARTTLEAPNKRSMLFRRKKRCTLHPDLFISTLLYTVGGCWPYSGEESEYRPVWRVYSAEDDSGRRGSGVRASRIAARSTFTSNSSPYVS